MRGKPWLLTIVATGLAGCFDNPFWASDRYEVTGAFKPDGSCSVFVDGAPMLTRFEFDLRPDSTEYWRDFASNVGMEPSEDLQNVTCGTLSISFRWHKGELLKVGRYPIMRGHPLPIPPIGTAGGFASPGQVDAGLWPFALPDVSLYSISGEVNLSHVDTALVVGKFAFIARRRSSM